MNRVEKSALVEVPLELAYAVVNDIERYPEFVPGCRQVTIVDREEGALRAEVTVSGTVMGQTLRESFVTKNTGHPPAELQMQLVRGPFRSLTGTWRFKALGDLGCRVDITLEYELEGVLMKMLASLVSPMADKMVDAFVERMMFIHANEV